MKRIIKGVTYNTDTASIVTTGCEGETESTIYKTRGGAFFRVQSWRGGEEQKCQLEPLTPGDVDRIIGRGVRRGGSPSATGSRETSEEAKSEAVLFVRMPASLKRRLDREARASDKSVNTIVLRCIEACLSRKTASPRSNLHTVEVSGKPTVVMSADDVSDVEEALDTYLGADLLVLEDKQGRPLWSGDKELIQVRRARREEEQSWRASYEKAVAEGEADADDDWAIFLVPVTDPTDDILDEDDLDENEEGGGEGRR